MIKGPTTRTRKNGPGQGLDNAIKDAPFGTLPHSRALPPRRVQPNRIVSQRSGAECPGLGVARRAERRASAEELEHQILRLADRLPTFLNRDLYPHMLPQVEKTHGPGQGLGQGPDEDSKLFGEQGSTQHGQRITGGHEEDKRRAQGSADTGFGERQRTTGG